MVLKAAILVLCITFITVHSGGGLDAKAVLSACCIRDSDLFWEKPNSEEYIKSLNPQNAIAILEDLICTKDDNVPIDDVAECEAKSGCSWICIFDPKEVKGHSRQEILPINKLHGDDKDKNAKELAAYTKGTEKISNDTGINGFYLPPEKGTEYKAKLMEDTLNDALFITVCYMI